MTEEDESWRKELQEAKSYHDMEVIFRRLWPMLFPKPFRKPLFDFPDTVIHAAESTVKKHPHYAAAKSGDAEAATILVTETYSREAAKATRDMLHGHQPTLVSAHAYEGEGINAIPETFAEFLASELDLPVESGIVQINMVGHTGANGFARLARQPVFDGEVTQGQEYFLVDDFVGMGGTLANLKGYIESKGGIVVGATVLTGKPYSAKLALDKNTLQELRDKHGKELEQWWREKFGHAFDCLTQSEARYLLKTADADTVRNRIIEAEQEGNR